jgi:WhiB family redox-sensing transcriptional regulator
MAPAEFFLKGLEADYTQSARGMCAMCPVHVECLEYAVANPGICGLWGGSDEREREAIRKLRAKERRAS